MHLLMHSSGAVPPGFRAAQLQCTWNLFSPMHRSNWCSLASSLAHPRLSLLYWCAPSVTGLGHKNSPLNVAQVTGNGALEPYYHPAFPYLSSHGFQLLLYGQIQGPPQFLLVNANLWTKLDKNKWLVYFFSIFFCHLSLFITVFSVCIYISPTDLFLPASLFNNHELYVSLKILNRCI